MIKNNDYKCRICYSPCKAEVIVGRELWAFSTKRFDYYECSYCGCIQISKYPQDIGEYYSGEYYSFNVNQGKSRINRWIINARDKYALTGKGYFGRLLCKIWPTSLFENIPFPEIGYESKILDVGCGDGSFLENLHQIGFVNLTGIDPFLKKEYTLNGELVIRKADIYELKEAYDCIILKGTLEHQPNQLKLLKKIRALLCENGFVVIRIPIADSYAWEYYRENWSQFDAPRHFYLHTVKSMELLATQAKMKIVKKVYDSGIFQFVGGEQIKAGIALHDERSYFVNRKKSIFSQDQIKYFKLQAQVLDGEERGDVVIFTLSKNGEI